MKRIYENLDAKKFRLLSCVMLIFCDFTIFYDIYSKFGNQGWLSKMLDVAINLNPQVRRSDLNPADVSQFLELMSNVTLTLLCFVFLYHLIIYLFWIKEKKFAAGYIALYVWIAGPATFITALMGLSDNFSKSLLYLLWSALFLFVAFGLSQFPIREKRSAAK